VGFVAACLYLWWHVSVLPWQVHIFGGMFLFFRGMSIFLAAGLVLLRHVGYFSGISLFKSFLRFLSHLFLAAFVG
jgi:hypothetical protein